MTAEEMEDTISQGQNLLRAVCTKPQCEEWRIHDYDGPIASCYSEEHPSIEELTSVMEMLDEDPDYAVSVMVLRDRYGEVTAEKLYDVGDEVIHIGFRSDLKDYFMEWAYDAGYMKQGHPMESYIDWEHFAQNCMYDYSEYEYNGSLYIVPNY
jgi:antirestriction protein